MGEGKGEKGREGRGRKGKGCAMAIGGMDASGNFKIRSSAVKYFGVAVAALLPADVVRAASGLPPYPGRPFQLRDPYLYTRIPDVGFTNRDETFVALET